MKTIKTYTCHCGEECYEDDVYCVNCGDPITSSLLIEQKIPVITYSGPVTEIEDSLI